MKRSPLKSPTFIYCASGVALLALSFGMSRSLPAWQWVLPCWTGLSLLTVGIAYWLNNPNLFRKRISGQIPLASKILFLPFLLGVSAYNRVARKRDPHPPIEQILPGLYLGRRLSMLDIELLQQQRIGAILDVTAEFDALEVSAQNLETEYLSIPVLDHQTPTLPAVLKGIGWIHRQRLAGRRVVIHCALGKGRSATMLLAYLAARFHHTDFNQTLALARKGSRRLAPNARQRRWLQDRMAAGELKLSTRALIVANPASGGGKWRDHGDEIKQRLSAFFELEVLETRADHSFKEQLQKSVESKPDLVIAAGGDGTLSMVAEQLVKTDIPMAIIPFGTANALGHVVLGPKQYLDPIETSCDAIINGTTETIDTLRCNGRTVLLMAGVGIEAKMISDASREHKNTSGMGAYLSAFTDAFANAPSFAATVTWPNGERAQIQTNSIVIANAAPRSSVLAQGGAEPDCRDGKFDMTWLIKSDSALDKVNTLVSLVTPEHQPNGLVQHRQATHAIIETDKPQTWVADGEVIGTTPLNICVEPKSLLLRHPAGV